MRWILLCILAILINPFLVRYDRELEAEDDAINWDVEDEGGW